MKTKDSQTKPDRGPIVQDQKPGWPHATAKGKGVWVYGNTYVKGDWIEGRTSDGKRCWV